MTGHTTNNCVHFKDLIQKAIKEGRLRFEEKEATMKVDANSFKVSSSFTVPMFILANIIRVKTN